MRKIQAEDIYTKIQHYDLVKVYNNQYYIFDEYYWKGVTLTDALRLVFNTFDKEERRTIATGTISEALSRISLAKENQLILTEENDQDYINVKNGVYSLKERRFIDDRTKMPFGYYLDFNYSEQIDIKKMSAFNSFIESIFPEEVHDKRKLLLQILGYMISDYTNAKVGGFFIGKSNSGKSTLLQLLRSIMPDNCISAVPLDRLNNRFNVARLCGKKINICTELKTDSFAHADIIKALTSNEIVTAEFKGRDPFEFRLRCKTINASNIIPDIDEDSDVEAMLNRLIILYFPISIPKEKLDLNLIHKLLNEKDMIFSSAINELIKLRANNFRFIEPSDSKEIKQQILLKSKLVDEFVNSECEKGEDKKEHFTTLYDAFKRYCQNNCIDMQLTKNQFNSKVSSMNGVIRKRFRKDGSRSALWGVEGIELKRYI